MLDEAPAEDLGIFGALPVAQQPTEADLGPFADLPHSDPVAPLTSAAVATPEPDLGPFGALPKSPTSETETVVRQMPDVQPDVIKATPTIYGELEAGRFGDAASMAYESVRRNFSGLLGPTEKEKSEQMIAWGKNPDGTVHYEYRPLGNRMEKEAGLMTSPFVSPETMLKPDKADGQLAKLGKAVYNSTAGLVGTLASPGTAILGLVGAGSTVLGRIAAGAFGIDMAAHLPETWHAIQEADKTEPGSQQRIETGLNALTQLVFLKAAADHARNAPVKPPAETTTSEPSFTDKTVLPPDAAAERNAEYERMSANLDRLNKDEPAGTAEGLPEGFVSVGASTGADISQPKTTSTKNAVTDAERKARGLSPIAQEVRQSNPETFDKAEKALADNPDHGQNIVKGLNDGTKREVSEVDEAVLLHEKITTQNEREAAGVRALDENLTPEERAEAVTRYTEMETRLNAIDQATHRAGTIWGRLGQFRQRLMADDYTFVSMERKARIAKGGPLTPEETATIKKQSTELERTAREAEAAIAKATEGEAGAAAGDAIDKIRVRADNETRANKKKGVERDNEGERAAILEGMKARIAEGDKPRDMRNWLQKLAENIVRAEPKIERDALLDKLHEEVAKVAPDMTRGQVRDALSGYGDVKLLNPDATKARLRDLKGQLQQVAKIEDMMRKQAPKKTGVERRTPSDEERRLIKLVNELKKKGGFVVTDPAKQLKSALDAIKTRLRNSISDLEHQIGTRTKIVKSKTGVTYDLEAEGLRRQRDTLKAEFEEIFGKPEMTDEQRIKLATSAVERGIAEYERRIADKDFQRKTTRTPSTPELEALRATRDSLREEYKLLEAAAHPERALETALRVYKAGLKRQTAQLEDRMARNDYAPRKPKAKPELDPEALALKFEHTKTKKAFTEKLLEWERAQHTIPQKVARTIGETFHTFRAIMTGGEMSALLRQGKLGFLAHPFKTMTGAVPAMFRAFRSEAGEYANMQEILSRPNADLYRQGDLAILDPNSFTKAQLEGNYRSKTANMIPFIAGSGRAFTAFTNRMRADLFDIHAATLVRRVGEVTPTDAKAFGTLVNEMTGSGSLGIKAGKATDFLNTIYFAPKYTMSRVQMLIGHSAWGGSKHTRRIVAEEYARILTGGAVMYAAYSLLKKEDDPPVDWDMNSSRFGLIKVGESWVDPMAGLAQVTVLSNRIWTGETTEQGEVRSLIDPDYGKRDMDKVLLRFNRSKLGPQAGTVYDLMTRKDFNDDPITLQGEVLKNVSPMTWGDIAKAMRANGTPEGVVLSTLAFFGESVKTFDVKSREEEPPATAGVGLPKF